MIGSQTIAPGRNGPGYDHTSSGHYMVYAQGLGSPCCSHNRSQAAESWTGAQTYGGSGRGHGNSVQNHHPCGSFQTSALDLGSHGCGHSLAPVVGTNAPNFGSSGHDLHTGVLEEAVSLLVVDQLPDGSCHGD